jgi:hypothetical protein
MKLGLLSIAAACCALLAVGAFFAGCQDDTGGGQQGFTPDLSDYSVLLYTDSYSYRGGTGSVRLADPLDFASQGAGESRRD